MPEHHLNKRVKALEEKVAHLEHLNTPRQQDKTSNNPQETTTEERDSTPGQFSSPENKQVKSSPRNSRQTDDAWYKTLQGWNSLLQIIAIPFAILYAVVTWCQWRDLRHNFQVDQRAWVGTVAPVVTEYKDPSNRTVLLKAGEIIRFGVAITNTGKTPALNMKTLVDFRDHPSSKKFQALYDQGEGPSKSTLFPSGRVVLYTKPTDIPAIQGDIDNIVNGKLTLYLYGKVTYDDVFGYPHYTTFCMYLGKNLVDFNNCDSYNTAN